MCSLVPPQPLVQSRSTLQIKIVMHARLTQITIDEQGVDAQAGGRCGQMARDERLPCTRIWTRHQHDLSVTQTDQRLAQNGVEDLATRKKLGKPAEGAVHIRLSMEGRDVVIEVGDDGGGLNRDKILEKAIEKGLVAAGANLSDEDIYQFIAKPGFSTVEQLDQISGRGVGMDVLFSGIKELGGSVEIQSELGKGSNFVIVFD